MNCGRRVRPARQLISAFAGLNGCCGVDALGVLAGGV